MKQRHLNIQGRETKVCVMIYLYVQSLYLSGNFREQVLMDNAIHMRSISVVY